MTEFDRVARALRGGDVLLIVPPFAAASRPQLGVHLLQALARPRGGAVEILYANLLFAALIGENNYVTVREADHRNSLLGERLFAEAAHGSSPLGCDAGAGLGALFREHPWELNFDVYRGFASLVSQWIERVVDLVEAGRYRAVGLTSSFEQINTSVALLKAIRRRYPEMITLIGGANCQGEMAAGTLVLCGEADLVFEGESEQTFVDFVDTLTSRPDWRPARGVVAGSPCRDLDTLPPPNYGDYCEQLHRCLPLSRMQIERRVSLAFETSRGCWWGQKHHCTFCGLNGEAMGYREKSPQRSLADLKALASEHRAQTGGSRVFMVDNIMPFRFFSSFTPMLAEEGLELEIFYEQKANLSLERVKALARAGVRHIQPGIEALSTTLLRLIDKGVTAAQNLALLRYSRAIGTRVEWNLLAGVPLDEEAMYREALELLPLLAHLEPPNRLGRLRVDRFSPYFQRPEAYGISRLRPLPIYSVVLPEGADVAQIAYHFEGDYESVAARSPELIAALGDAVEAWRRAWEDGRRPRLEVLALDDQRFELVDERGLLGSSPQMELRREEAAALLVARPWRQVDAAVRERALERHLAAHLDDLFVPLATAAPELLEAFEAEATAAMAPRRRAPAGSSIGAVASR